MYKKGKINKKQSKGITLIALVITIIVLLILAGVTINTLFNNGNAIDKAAEARDETNKGNIKEQLELAVITSRINDNNANINTDKLKNELDKLKNTGIIDSYEPSGEDFKLPSTVKKGSYEFTIDEEGNVTAKDGQTPPSGGGETGEVTLKPTEDSTASPESVQMSTNFGTIDVIWLKGKTNTPTTTPNKPILQSGNESLTPVKFVEDASKQGHDKWVEADKNNNDNEWYNYEAGNGNSSKWANARTANNSYFVWIPRYAYRITYYEKDPTEVTENNEPTGYYDGFGMWNTDGEIKYELDQGVETTTYNGESYIVHPAFMKDIGIKDAEGNLLPDYERGGWSDDLEGFWFAKFEMGGSTAAGLNSQFGTASITNQNIGLQYENARKATFGYTGTQASDINANSFMNSHMVKNSEWGAVAYLTHSQYGLNGKDITINNNGTSYYRGGGEENAYIDNINQSTTGNVYGIYDMSGNAFEYVASYDRLGDSSYLTGTSYGGNLTKYAKDEDDSYISTKYITAYDNGTSGYSGTKIYEVGKVGDGTKETYLGTGNYGWFSDCAYFAASGSPFFGRGGYYGYGSYAGVFYSNDNIGYSNSYYSFRVSLCE